MKIFQFFLSATLLTALQGCGVSEPSDSSLKSSAALADQKSLGDTLDLQKYENLEISEKKCVMSADKKIANCTFMLNNKLYALKFNSTGSDWSYAGMIRR